jgi:hypothetical protein
MEASPRMQLTCHGGYEPVSCLRLASMSENTATAVSIRGMPRDWKLDMGAESERPRWLWQNAA